MNSYKKILATTVIFSLHVSCMPVVPQAGDMLAPPGASIMAGSFLSDIKLSSELVPGVPGSVQKELDLSSEDIDMVAISIIELLEETLPEKKIFLYCVPESFEQAVIAMKLGFISPRNEKELDMVKHLGFGNSVTTEDLIKIAEREFKGKESKLTSTRYPQEAMEHTLQLSKKTVVGGLECEKLIIVTGDNTSTNQMANAIRKYNLQEFRHGVKNACVLDFPMLLQDESCIKTLAGSLSEEAEKIANRINSVEEEEENLKLGEKAIHTEELIAGIERVLETAKAWLIESKKEQSDEEELRKRIVGTEKFLETCMLYMGKKSLLDENIKSELKKVNNQLESSLKKDALAFAKLKFEGGDLDSAGKILEEYFGKGTKYPGVKELLDEIRNAKKSREKKEAAQRVKRLKGEIRDLMNDNWERAWEMANNAKSEYSEHEEEFNSLCNEVTLSARENVLFWIPKGERKKLMEYYKKVVSLESDRDKISNKAPKNIIALKGVGRENATKGMLGLYRKQASLLKEVNAALRDFGHQICKYDENDEDDDLKKDGVWKVIDAQARKLSKLKNKEEYWPKNKDDFKKILKKLNIEAIRAAEEGESDIPLDIVKAYLQVIPELYDTEDKQKGHLRLDRLRGASGLDGDLAVKVKPSRKEKDKVVKFLNVVNGFRKMHGELSREGKNADKEAKDFIRMLQDPEYIDVYKQVGLACAREDTLAGSDYLDDVIKSDPIDLIDYDRVVFILEKTEFVLKKWKKSHPKKKDTVNVSWEDMVFWDTVASEEEVSSERRWRRGLWHNVISMLSMILFEAQSGGTFNRVVKTIKSGRTVDAYMLAVLPELGYKPVIEPEGFIELLSNGDSYSSCKILPSFKDSPPELVIELNRESGWKFTIDHLGDDEPEGEDGRIRIFLFEDSRIETEIKPYGQLIEDERLNLNLLAELLKSGKAKIVMEHILIDPERYCSLFAGGTANAKMLEIFRPKALKKIYKIEEVILKLKNSTQISRKLDRADFYQQRGNLGQALRVVKDALSVEPNNEDLIERRDELSRFIERNRLIQAAEESKDSENLKRMKEALENLEIFFTGTTEKQAVDVITENLKDDSEAFFAWWTLNNAVREFEERIKEREEHLNQALGALIVGRFQDAKGLIEQAIALGATYADTKDLLMRVNVAEINHGECEKIGKDLDSIEKNTLKAKIDLEDLGEIIDGLNKYKERLVKMNKATLLKTVTLAHGVSVLLKLHDKETKLKEAIADASDKIKDELDIINGKISTIRNVRDINPVRTKLKALIGLFKDVPSREARMLLHSMHDTFKDKFYRKANEITTRNRQNIHKGLIDLGRELSGDLTRKELEGLKGSLDGMKKAIETVTPLTKRQSLENYYGRILKDFENKKDEIDEKIDSGSKDFRQKLQGVKNCCTEDSEKTVLDEQKEVLQALKAEINGVPSIEVQEVLLDELKPIEEEVDRLLAVKIDVLEQLDLIEKIEGQIEHNNLIGMIKQWPVEGRRSLIEQNIDPEQLAKHVYVLLEKLDERVPEAKKFKDKITAEVEEVVKAKKAEVKKALRAKEAKKIVRKVKKTEVPKEKVSAADEIVSIEREPREKKKKPPKGKKPEKKVLVEKDIEFVDALIEDLPGINKAFDKALKTLLIAVIKGSREEVEYAQEKVVMLLTKKRVEIPAKYSARYGEVLTARKHLEDPDYIELREYFELLPEKHTELNSIMYRLMVARFKGNLANIGYVKKRASELLSKKNMEKDGSGEAVMTKSEVDDYRALLAWEPGADMPDKGDASKRTVTKSANDSDQSL